MVYEKICKGTFLFVLHVAIFLYLIQYVINDVEIMQKIEDAPLWMVVVGIVSMGCSLVLTGFLDVTCANGYGISIGKWGAIGMTFIASAINLILPMQLGSVIKAAYFKKSID